MRERRKRPDRLPQLIAAHRQALVDARRSTSTTAILIGKSMGGRIGCHVALEEKVAGLVCLGYPLCAMGDRTKLRDKVLRALTTPILFVQGTRDSLCPLDLLEPIRAGDDGRKFYPCRRGRRPFIAGDEANATNEERNAGRCQSKDTRSHWRIRRPITEELMNPQRLWRVDLPYASMRSVFRLCFAVLGR